MPNLMIQLSVPSSTTARSSSHAGILRAVEKLRAAKIDVDVGVNGDEAEALIAPWKKFVVAGRPYVSLKLALSLDGRIATRTGASVEVPMIVLNPNVALT